MSDNHPVDQISDTTMDSVQDLVDLLAGSSAPCLGHPFKVATEDSCLKRWHQQGTPYYKYDSEDMCACCAAYWHVTMAAQRLRTARRTGSSHGL